MCSLINTMQACTAEAQQLNKSIHVKQRVCSIFAKTRSYLQNKLKCAYHMDALPSPPLETPLLYHIFTRCIGTDVKSPRSLRRTLKGIHHHAQGYDLKPHPWTTASRLSRRSPGEEQKMIDLRMREGSIELSHRAQQSTNSSITCNRV